MQDIAFGRCCLELRRVDGILPDELLYSIAARQALLNSIGSGRRATILLLGWVQRSAPSLPTRLDLAAQRIGLLCGLSTPTALLQKTTIYPYFRCLISRQRWSAALRIIESSDSRSGILSVLGSRKYFGRMRLLQRCRRCDHESFEALGAVYWHRMHQLPGVRVCLKHGCLLDGFIVPDAQLCVPPLDFGNATTLPGTPQDFQFARVSDEMLRFGGEVPASPERKRAYVYALRQRGLVHGATGIQWSAAAAEFIAYWSASKLFETYPSQADNGAPKWFVDALLHPETLANPVPHVAMVAWLFGSMENFAKVATDAALEKVSRPVTPNASKPIRSISPAVWDETLTGNQAAIRAGMTATQVLRLRRSAGLAVASSPWKISEEMRELIISALSLGISRPTIANAFNISRASVTLITGSTPGSREKIKAARHALALNKHRSHWLLTRAQHPDYHSTAIRKLIPATYWWLHKHDLTWLKENSPHPMRSNGVHWSTRDARWSTRDARLAVSAREVAAKYLAAHGVRISRASLVGTVYQWKRYFLHPGKLPAFARAVAELSDVYPAPRKKHRHQLERVG